MEDVLVNLFEDCCSFCSDNRHECPTFDWICRYTLKVLQQYPAGMTQAVLLTELEAKWRQAVRSGEHTGKLLRVLTTKQLELNEVISGIIVPQDDFRFKLYAPDTDIDIINDKKSSSSTTDSSSGSSSTVYALECIAHRQTGDFASFTAYHSYELKGHMISLTYGRLLKQAGLGGSASSSNGSGLYLLPTPYLSYWFDYRLPNTRSFLQNELFSLHTNFIDLCMSKILETSRTATMNIANIVDTLNTQVGVVIGTVESIGGVLAHPQQQSSTIVVIKLNIYSNINYTQPNQGHDNNTKKKSIYLLLLDEQISLARLWNKGDLLFIYRPYVSINATEILFGSKKQGTSNVPGAAAMAHEVVVRPIVDLDGALEDTSCLPVHLWYGGITVINKIYGISSTNITAEATTSQNMTSPISNYEVVKSRKRGRNDDNVPTTSTSDLSIPSPPSVEQHSSSNINTFLSICHRKNSRKDLTMLTRVLAVSEYTHAGASSSRNTVQERQGCLWLQALMEYDDNKIGNKQKGYKVGILHLRYPLNEATTSVVQWPRLGQLLWVSGVRHDLQLSVCMSSLDASTATIGAVSPTDIMCAPFDLKPPNQLPLWAHEAHILPVICHNTINSTIDYTMNSNNTDHYHGSSINYTQSTGVLKHQSTTLSETNIMNVSNITALMHSPTILQPICLQELQQQCYISSTYPTSSRSMKDAGSLSACTVVVAHVVEAQVEPNSGVLLLLLSDKTGTICAHMSDSAVNLTSAPIALQSRNSSKIQSNTKHSANSAAKNGNSGHFPNSMSSLSDSSNNSIDFYAAANISTSNSLQNERNICTSWKGRQCKLLLSRTDDVQPSQSSQRYVAEAVANMNEKYLSYSMWPCGWMGTSSSLAAASSTAQMTTGDTDATVGKSQDTIYFRVDAVSDVEPCAAAWSLLKAHRAFARK